MGVRLCCRGDDDDRRPRGELSAACSSITPRGNAAATNSLFVLFQCTNDSRWIDHAGACCVLRVTLNTALAPNRLSMIPSDLCDCD